MSEWTRPAQPVRCIVDLTAPLTVRRERGVLVQGDENANAIVVEVYQGKDVPYDLSGSTVTLTFVRPDKLAAPPISAEITGNVAVMTLTDTCYRVSGMYAASVKLLKGDTERTIVRVMGDIISTGNDGTVDDEQLFPSPEELLETLLQVEQARTNAETAANRANTAAARAEQLQIDASGYAGDSNNLGGKPPEYYLPAVNLLDNPDFAIAQAGYGGLHGTTKYAADRWKNSAIVTAPTSSSGIKISGGTWDAELQQSVAAVARLRGKTVTAVVNFKSELGTWWYGLSARTSQGTEIGSSAAVVNCSEHTKAVITLEVPVDTEVLLFTLDNPNSSYGTVEVDWAALYEGAYTIETLPPFVPPDPMMELAKCQRYYRVIGQASVLFAPNTQGSYRSSTFPVGTTMRASKFSVNVKGSGGLYANGPHIGDITSLDGITVETWGGSGINFNITDARFAGRTAVFFNVECSADL